MRKVKIHTETLKDAAAFAKHWPAISQLRQQLGVNDDVLLSPLHFLASTDETRRSASVACFRDERLIGVLYATEHFVRGVRTGYAIGGDFSGRGLLLCADTDENTVLKECSKRKLADGIHSLHLRLLPRDDSHFILSATAMRFLDATIPGDRMLLKPTYEEFLSTLGKHTRRNIRACTRKTEAVGIEFAPSISREEYQAAIELLNTDSDFRAAPLHLARDERVLALHYGGERHGLRGPDGSLIAVLCGFRSGDRFHLLTQLNAALYERFSLSLVLRGYAIEHLIAAGCTELQFMGGSSLTFGRFCQHESYRSIFVDKNKGLAAAAKLLSSRMVDLLARVGSPIPETLAVISSGYLEHRRLTDRTVLRPAAMLFEGRQTS